MQDFEKLGVFYLGRHYDLEKGAPGQDVLAAAKLLKLGKRLAVGGIALYSEGETELAAHATATYSLPHY